MLFRSDLWEKSYPDIHLPAELLARDAWLSDQPSAAQKNWYTSTSTQLANRNAKAMTAKAAAIAANPVIDDRDASERMIDHMRDEKLAADCQRDYAERRAAEAKAERPDSNGGASP